MIGLDEMSDYSSFFGKRSLVATFKEKPTVIFKDSGFNNKNLRNICGYDVHPCLLVTCRPKSTFFALKSFSVRSQIGLNSSLCLPSIAPPTLGGNNGYFSVVFGKTGNASVP